MDHDRILVGVLIISVLGVGFTMFFFGFIRTYPDLFAPKFTLVSFTLQALNVSASTQRVGGNWGARFRVRSKGFDLDYADMESTVYYNGELLSRADILARGSAGFDVRLVGKLGCSVAVQQRLQVLCGVVPVTVSEDGSSGSFDDGPRKCKVILDELPN